MILKKCIHFESGEIVPIKFSHGEKTIKSYVEESIRQLGSFYEKLGKESFEKDLDKFEKING